ncbi:MAG: hypothetical protein IT365_15215 [Candidatus Hydrogenedentes bacterium]|nr:hypothetical protein [Candidatus Hydrogenedentota bacterium]
MKNVVRVILVALLSLSALAYTDETKQPFDNTDLESGDLRGWTADANWRVDNNAAGGWYNGWHGRWYAWSGEGGEQATGKLRSPLFTLTKEGVKVWVAGWADIHGQTANRWNYVALHLADGTELDRRYAPNSVTFTPLVLIGSGHVGEQVYLEAVDDAPEGSYSMLCIDQIALVDVKDALAMPVARARRVHVLENEHYRVEVDRRHGTIRRILDKAKNLELIREPRLAGNYEFSLPIKKEEAWQNTEANYILGNKQRLDACTQRENGLTLTWEGPLRSVFGEEYDATVTMRIDLAADDVVFNLSIDNRSALEVGEVYYPILGGLRGLGETQQDLKDTYLALPYGAGLKTSRPFYVFDNMVPFGSLYPEQYHRYPDALSMPWLDLYNARLQRGVYIGAHDPIARNKTFQLLHVPGTASVRMDGNWPRPEELDGQPTGVRLCMVQIIYQPAGQTFEASPVVLRFHDGDWRAGAAAYRDWLTREIGTAASRGDAAGFHPVGRIPYAQLPEHAKAALEKGLKVLLLTDWKAGSQNDGVPRLELDPSLGTPDDLKHAIAQCHQLGVRVIFLFNVQHVNPASDWYQQELHQYVTIDRWGVPATWGERRWHFVGLAFPELQHHWAGQVRTLAELGADGIHLRDFFPPAMDFNPGLPSTPDRSSWEGGLMCIRQMAEEGRKGNPELTISTNLVRDRLIIDAPISEAEMPETSAFREVFPQWRVLNP